MITNDLLIGSIFLAGLASFFSPCIFPIIPIYLGILSKGKKTILNTFLFIFGLSLTFVFLGFSFGFLGSIFFNDNIRIIAGILVIILGIHQIGFIHFSFLEKTKLFKLKNKIENPSLEALILGLTFSLGWTPCIGPILASILALSSEKSSAVYGALLMFIYVLGLSMPFIIFSLFSNVLIKKTKSLHKYLDKFKIIGGILIIFMGILLIFNKLHF